MAKPPPPPVELVPVLRQLAELRPILRQLVNRLDDQGDEAVRRAFGIAARGYPASTNGNEGGRSSDPTSSTERAALNPGMFDDIDGRLWTHLRMCAYFAKLTHANLNVIMSEGTDDDPVPVGTGHCLRCEKFCRPDDKHPHNRIRAGFCPACDTAWRRAGKPDRGMFIRSYLDEAAAG